MDSMGLHTRDLTLPNPVDDSKDNRLTNYAAFVGFTAIVWDHIITLPEEVQYIWKGRKSPLVYLFLLNRYSTPLFFIGNLVAYFSDWTYDVCARFVRYEGATIVVAIEVTGLMMLQRVRALYNGNWKIVGFVVFVLLIETAVNAWLLTHGQPVRHNPTSGVTACSMIFDPDLHFWPSLSAWLPLIYDSIVIGLTLLKCLGPVKNKTASHIVRTLLKDGLMYYSVIFAVNFVLAIMIVTAADGVKNISAQLEQLLTVAMMSRITLNLRREAQYSDGAIISQLHPNVSSEDGYVNRPDTRKLDLSFRRMAGRGTGDALTKPMSKQRTVGFDLSEDELEVGGTPIVEDPQRASDDTMELDDLDSIRSSRPSTYSGLNEQQIHTLRTMKATPV